MQGQVTRTAVISTGRIPLLALPPPPSTLASIATISSSFVSHSCTLTGKSIELVKTLKLRRVNIACIQETKWKGSKARQIDGWKLWYSGTSSCRNGVGILADQYWTELVVQVDRLSDRILRVKFVDGASTINVISVYAPHVGLDSSEKERFWEMLDELMRGIPDSEMVWIGGDFNGHIGGSRSGYEVVHGGFGIGDRNDSGRELLEFSVAFGCIIANSWFHKNHEHLVTFHSGAHKTQIDYFLMRKEHRSCCKDCKSIPFCGLSTQHRLLILDLEWASRKKRLKPVTLPRIRWWRLSDSTAQSLRDRVCEEANAMGAWRLRESANEMWTLMAGCVRRAAKAVLGLSRGRRGFRGAEAWWDEEVKVKILAKQTAFRAWMESTGTAREFLLGEYKAAKREAKKAVALAKTKAFEGLYKALDEKGGEKLLYKLARFRHGQSGDLGMVRCIRDEEGRALTEDCHIRQRWQRYFCDLLNEEPRATGRRRGPISGDQSRESPHRCISKDEVQEALRKMGNKRAVGPDEIPVEFWKCLGAKGVEWLTTLFNVIYRTSSMPEEWRRSNLIPVYKNKGDVQLCNNYRGIKLLSHTMKVWEKVLEARIRREAPVSENQFGFMPGRSSIEAIHLMRRLVEAYRERNRDLHMVFIDLEKAYDSVPRDLLWDCLEEKGVSRSYIRLLKDMYEGAATSVYTPGGATEFFKVGVGLHQGSALSPFLFAVVMDVLTRDIQQEAPWCMLFADDIVLVDESKDEVYNKLEQWRDNLESMGLKLSRTKTEYVEFKFSQEIVHCGEPMRLGDVALRSQDKFKYLGSYVQSDGSIEADITHRIQRAWQKWRAASGVLCDRKVPIKLKGKFYRTVVRPALLYGAECWPTTKIQERKLRVTEMRMLRWMCGHTKLDRIRNDDIRDKVGVASIEDKLREARLRWFGHIQRRPLDATVRRCENLDLGEFRRSRGRPKKRWMDVIQQDLANLQISADLARCRDQWRVKIYVPDR